MIRASRADVDAHVVRHGIPYCDDPSNQDPRFSRVRVRNELMPILQDLGLGIVGHLVGLADEAATLPEPLGLNREQRSQLRRALKNPTIAVDLPLGGGLRLFRGPATKGANSRVRSKSTSID
jgi:tRNA(Ile)-lysidine synthase